MFDIIESKFDIANSGTDNWDEDEESDTTEDSIELAQRMHDEEILEQQKIDSGFYDNLEENSKKK